MILNALSAYYQRLADDPGVDVAPLGFEHKAIDFLIKLDDAGKFVNFHDLREGTGKKRKGRLSLVPKGIKRSSGIAANLLWDTVPYVLGRALPEKGKNIEKSSARAVEQHKAFVEKVEQTLSGCSDRGAMAVLSFLRCGEFNPIFEHTLWDEVEQSGGNITFSLAGDTQLVCQHPEVVAAISEKLKPEGELQACSVSGKKNVPAILHTAIKGVWGAQSSGANIVSFNLDAFRSFGKKQGFNAPVGSSIEFAYTTALNYLLASANQRMQVGDASTVFWARDPCDFEKDLHPILAPKKGEEAVSYNKIRGLLSAVKTGLPLGEEDLPFYVLGLAPNASRIAVRFWCEGNVKKIKERVAEHFLDIEMVRAPHDPEFLSLFQLLVSTATERKADNIPPNLGGEVARSVFTGTAYPRTLFANAIRRCKAEQKVTFARASIIKGVLTRMSRTSNLKDKEVSVALDKSYDNIGYVLGRLFAVLEWIQELAHTPEGKKRQNLNKTIRDTYFGAATSSPLITFKRLDELSVHHLAKIRNSGKGIVWLEQLKQEVFGHIPAKGIPSILDLEDQGRFSVGYYHQRQDFFTSKKTEEIKENTNG
ncbi:type I-C CRISPR-associated protein Cas8c/Csd1 [Desulfosarcina ovata]|uniref:Type I-C CRISPR-associated protein Cas8c/Csd1 n=1 Tax=Desulfosarcina ovata subsp. ovata TaxID=2752305 RepID=A0A5K8A3U3_9BACT|nr:type I-C CRISPR-associated protein Cas8c/Csd1 [Desulfosarcina ovata]BBO87263.1 type I-C CRISPR-associated protein Cas8c/Csd1 [Desulfosarcina ovata subsp. ovata]